MERQSLLLRMRSVVEEMGGRAVDGRACMPEQAPWSHSPGASPGSRNILVLEGICSTTFLNTCVQEIFSGVMPAMVRVGFQKKHPRKWLFASVLSAAKGPGIALVSPLMGGGRVERGAQSPPP